jgi:hypothetical protein
MRNLTIGTLMAVVLGVAAGVGTTASAAPIGNLATVPDRVGTANPLLDRVHWRGWRHCHWRHGWRRCHGGGYGYYYGGYPYYGYGGYYGWWPGIFRFGHRHRHYGHRHYGYRHYGYRGFRGGYGGYRGFRGGYGGYRGFRGGYGFGGGRGFGGFRGGMGFRGGGFRGGRFR